jgi:hypothetical protein
MRVGPNCSTIKWIYNGIFLTFLITAIPILFKYVMKQSFFQFCDKVIINCKSQDSKSGAPGVGPEIVNFI